MGNFAILKKKEGKSMSFYENFKGLCYEKGKSKTMVLEECGINKSATTRWSRGEMPSERSARALSDYFGVSIKDLLGTQQVSVKQSTTLDPEEANLLAAWRDATIDEKQLVAFALRKHGFYYDPYKEKVI